MNNIVLYKLLLTMGILLCAVGMKAQKPNIELIPSSYQHMPPEAIVDTSLALDSMVQNIDNPATGVQEKDVSPKHVKKERRQIGPSLDTLFRKSENKKAASNRNSRKLSFYIRQFNQFIFFIRITP